MPPERNGSSHVKQYDIKQNDEHVIWERRGNSIHQFKPRFPKPQKWLEDYLNMNSQ